MIISREYAYGEEKNFTPVNNIEFEVIFFGKFVEVRFIKEPLVYHEYAAIGQGAFYHTLFDFTDCRDIFVPGAVYYRKSGSGGKYVFDNGEKFVHFCFVEVTDEEADNGAVEFLVVERIAEQVCL